MRRLLGALLLVSALAQAHGVNHPRTLLLAARPFVLEAFFTLELPVVEARKVKQLFDRNRDGVLAPSERTLLGDYLEKRAIGEFELRRGDERLEPEPVSRELKGVDDPRASLAIQVVRRWKLHARETLTVRDRGDTEGHLPVRVEGEGVSIRFGGVKHTDAWSLPANERVSLRILPD